MRVLIADDHELLRDFFDAWLRKEGIEVTAACDLPAALEIARKADPFDLVLLDFRMPGMDRLDGLARFLAEGKGAAVALMSGNAARDVVEDALRMGAAGFLSKVMPPNEFVAAVRAMAKGDRITLQDDPSAPRAASIDATPPGALTRRERDVLEKLCEGKSDADIARDLGLGEPTVRLHLKTLCRKLGTPDRAAAADLARIAGMV
ncbi:MAG: response regulator [Roseicyclus sp.]|uniref:response regulator n=1 Tax=Roseicyclus sp. TaxID=1914329 RepID=UPI003A88AB9C